jgi:transposase
MASDARGRPLRLILTPGQSNDITQAEALLEGFEPTHVLADKGYDSRAFDSKTCPARNAIERCFGRLKQVNPEHQGAHERAVAGMKRTPSQGASWDALDWLHLRLAVARANNTFSLANTSATTSFAALSAFLALWASQSRLRN